MRNRNGGRCLVERLQSDTMGFMSDTAMSVSEESGTDDGGYICLRTLHEYLLITPSEVLLITKGV